MKTGTNLVEYANCFHHDTNAAWETEQINVQELAGFARSSRADAGHPGNRLGSSKLVEQSEPPVELVPTRESLAHQIGPE